VPLNHLVGRRFRIGEVILRGGRLNFPCKYLEELLGKPVYLPLYNRSGLNCSIERGGRIRAGDIIQPIEL
jgi:MOSC domain-containing protein YiiM